MTRRRFFFVEPSKVSTQHITLIDGYLQALAASSSLRQSTDLIFCASQSTFDSLPASTRAQVTHRPIPVMNPENRRLIIKSILEFLVVLRYVLGMRKGDIVFVTCMLAPALLMLEAVNRVLRRPSVYITLHGEVEGMFDKARQHIRSYGYWVGKWIRFRRPDSTLRLVVIDDFIKEKLVEEFPDVLRPEQIFVVHHPVLSLPISAPVAESKPKICFIGYKTAYKGFDQFKRLSEMIPQADFLAIGGGKVENMRHANTVPLQGNDDYLRAIAACSVAMFPYVSGYTCSLSAAALDALSAGAHIVATPRPCFISLQKHLGPEVVTISESVEDAARLMRTPAWLEQRATGKEARLKLVAGSKYGVDAVRRSLEKLALNNIATTNGVV